MHTKKIIATVCLVMIGLIIYGLQPSSQKTKTVSAPKEEVIEEPPEAPTIPAGSNTIVSKKQVTKKNFKQPVNPLDLLTKDEKLNECWAKLNENNKLQNSFLEKIKPKLDTTIGRWFYDKDAKINSSTQPSAPDLFYRGIQSAGLLFARETTTVNDDAAVELLIKANELDPKNSAPLLFAAFIEARRGNDILAKVFLQKASESTTEYSNYLSDIFKVAFKQVDSGSDILGITEMTAQIPIPDLQEVAKFLKGNHIYDFGEQLVADTLNPDKKIDFVEFSIIEYSIGRSMLQEAGAGRDLASFRDLPQQKEFTYSLASTEEYEQLANNCDPSLLNQAAQRYKDYNFK